MSHIETLKAMLNDEESALVARKEGQEVWKHMKDPGFPPCKYSKKECLEISEREGRIAIKVQSRIAALTAAIADMEKLNTAEAACAEMRKIFPKILKALGNGAQCVETVSLEFLKHIPDEVRLYTVALNQQLAEARKEISQLEYREAGASSLGRELLERAECAEQQLAEARKDSERLQEVKHLLGEFRLLLRSYDSGKLNSASWRAAMDYTSRLRLAIDAAQKGDA